MSTGRGDGHLARLHLLVEFGLLLLYRGELLSHHRLLLRDALFGESGGGIFHRFPLGTGDP